MVDEVKLLDRDYKLYVLPLLLIFLFAVAAIVVMIRNSLS